MEELNRIIRELFMRDLKTSPVETALFFTVIFGFFGVLVVANRVRHRKEKRRYHERLKKKWEELCEKYQISEEDVDFLEELSLHLKYPEKKYLLLTDYNVLHDVLDSYGEDHEVDASVIERIEKKAGLREGLRVDQSIPIQRRKKLRKKVNISAKIAPIEQTAAHIETRMLDLSSGGCKIENPEKRFRAGDDLKITFDYEGKTYRNIPCEVVRTGAGQRTLHISFGHGKMTQR